MNFNKFISNLELNHSSKSAEVALLSPTPVPVSSVPSSRIKALSWTYIYAGSLSPQYIENCLAYYTSSFYTNVG